MATFVLVPGAGGDSWYWHRLTPLLEAAGHEVVAPDLPAGDEQAGLLEYTEVVLAAAKGHTDLVVVGQSLGGFTAPLVVDRLVADPLVTDPLVTDRLPVELLVLLNAMIPNPGERAGDWWGNTGMSQARSELAAAQGRSDEFDLMNDFFHDVPAEVVEATMARGEPQQSDKPMTDSWPLAAWPDVPTKVLTGRDDRFFPLAFQQRVARERLNLTVDQIPGGHLAALSRPKELAEQLLSFLN
jgi:pimeloyl-ACP methyl ester carboxylesterase